MNRVHSAASGSIPVEDQELFPRTRASLGRLSANIAYFLMRLAFRINGPTAATFVCDAYEAAIQRKDTTHDR